MIPYVVDNVNGTERTYDIYSRLVEERIVFLKGAVDEHTANSIVAQMLFLNSKDSKRPISFYINSPGGVVTEGLAIYDTMNHIAAPVHTICIGQACSMGSLLLTAGEPGHRYALPSSRIMIHQPLGGAQGQASDMEIRVREILKLKEFLTNIYVKTGKKSFKQFEKLLDRDTFLSPEEAKELGLIDKVL